MRGLFLASNPEKADFLTVADTLHKSPSQSLQTQQGIFRNSTDVPARCSHVIALTTATIGHGSAPSFASEVCISANKGAQQKTSFHSLIYTRFAKTPLSLLRFSCFVSISTLSDRSRQDPTNQDCSLKN